ncbi:Flp pilus assembly protein CpaB [Lignipirellula cremea]|uniref:SAF domain protein n=1 Tax=Lignipirellula cremea TaxID=2528010 RepID=A0A518E1L9_9BACT|nr:Flp pilus assembly protein CpaB [Lignipirellula cremea]QDU97961.1 SAF domain protein [Lignipirellula cremea]
MKAKSMMLIVIALVCGLVASIGVSQVVNRKGNAQVQVDQRPILVAMKDIDIGDKMTAENVQLEQWPADRIPEGAVSDIEQLDGQFARARFVKGEFVLQQKIGASLTPPVPDGYRIMPLKVQREYVSNLLKPGDFVDISLYFKKRSAKGGNQEQVSTILTNVRVYEVSGRTELSATEEEAGGNVSSLSVLVTPKQALNLSLAQEIGKLRLLQRSNTDRNELVDVDEVNVASLLGAGPESATERSPDNGDSDFMSFVNQQNGDGGAMAAVPVVAAPVHTMIIFTPEGPMQYDWNNAAELPRQVPLNGASPQLPGANGTKPTALGGLNDLNSLNGLNGSGGLNGGLGSGGTSDSADHDPLSDLEGLNLDDSVAIPVSPN